jgi:PAS domain S-box-containing protein
MITLYLIGIVLRTLALILAVMLMRRLRDWRLSIVVAVVGLVAVEGAYHAGTVFQTRLEDSDPFDAVLELVYSVVLLGGVYTATRFLYRSQETEEALKRSEFVLAKAQEAAHIGSWHWDPMNNRFFWSDSMLAMFHLDRAHFDGRLGSILLAVHPDDRERVLSAMRALPHRLENFPMEYRVRARDGSIRHIWAECTVQQRDSGRHEVIIGSVQDITQRVEAERALRESGIRLQLLNEIFACAATAPPEGALVSQTLSALGRAFEDCQAYFGLIGRQDSLRLLTAEEALIQKEPVRRRVPLDAAPEVLRLLQDRAAVNIYDVQQDFRVASISGELFALGARALFLAPVHYRNDRLGLLCMSAPSPRVWTEHQMATMKEVAEYLAGALRESRAAEERARTEAVLRANEERFQTVLRSVSDVICATRADGGEFLYLNDAVERVFGRAAREFYADAELWWKVIHNDDRSMVAENTRELFRHDEAECEHRILLPDGEERWVNMRRTLTRDAHGRPATIAGVIKDITNRHRVEAQAHHAQKLESLGVMAGGFAHQFNNLIMGILSNASLAREELPLGLPALSHSLAYIESGAERAANLCTQLLAYTGQGEFRVEDIDMNAYIRELTPLIAPSLPLKNRLELQLAEDIPPIEGNRPQLQQMLFNLTVNASEAMRSEGGAITVQTGTHFADRGLLTQTFGGEKLASGNYVTIRVMDTGTGMDRATIAKIFDPFFTTKFAGRGLGLAAVLGIVRAHGGAVQVTSKVGRGSTFTIYLPVCSKDVVTSTDWTDSKDPDTVPPVEVNLGQ